MIGAYMIDGPTTASSSQERDTSQSRNLQIHLLPRVLVTSYDDARLVTIEQQQRLVMILVSKQPVVDCARETVPRSAPECNLVQP